MADDGDSEFTPEQIRQVEVESRLKERGMTTEPVPPEKKRAARKRGMFEHKARERFGAKEVEMRTGPRDEDRAVMTIMDTTGEHLDADKLAAPAPPPGYRYTMDGRLAPLFNSRIPISDPRGQEIFLEILEITGSVRSAMDAIGMPVVDTLKKELVQNQEFCERFDAAQERHRDSLYAAAYQRAVHGVAVPVMGGQFKDRIVAYERKYSDSIMILMLKRHFPEFREATANRISVDNSQHKTINMEIDGADVSKLNREQRDKLRAFLESVRPEETRVIEATGEEKKQ